MTYAAPIEMPNPLPVNAKAFDLSYNQDMTPVGSGFIQTIERAPPMWVAQYSTPPLDTTRDQVFQAFLDALYGSQNSFLGFDPRRPRPLSVLSIGGAPWERVNGTAPTCIGASFASAQVALAGLATGFVFSRGDYVSFLRDNAWHLHRIRTIGAVVGGGGTITLDVTPRPRNSSTVVDVRLQRPAAAFKIIGRVDKKDKVDDLGPSYNFQAVQFIDRTSV